MVPVHTPRTRLRKWLHLALAVSVFPAFERALDDATILD